MSDEARRRRKPRLSHGSDDLSDSYDEDLNTTKETQSSEHTEDRHDSEYDTAGTDSNSESQDGAQRESGDGQEEEQPKKKLDDDEDRRNPQYIPKRGTFYEHDDRTAEEAEDAATETPPEREVKEKKVWKDKEDRWDHDRYNDEEQAPKSHEELIAIYGYDIRNEEGPPRARRRRRYGRGPNKYTRNWEDENAYGKMASSNSSKGSRRVNRSGEEFPALNSKNKDASVKVEEPVISSAWYNNKNKSQTKQQNFPLLQNQKETDKTKPAKSINNQQVENKVINDQNNVLRKKDVKAPTQMESPNDNTTRNASGNNLTSQEKMTPSVKVVSRENKRFSQETQVRSRGRGYKANQNNNIINKMSPTDNKMKGRGTVPNVIENKRMSVQNVEEQQQQLVHDMKQVHVSDNTFNHARQNKHFYTQSSSQQRTSTGSSTRMQPPHQQAQITSQQKHSPQQPQQPQSQQQQADVSGNRPKRYSSLRQRPQIPEGPAQQNYQPQPQPQQHGYYTTQAGNSRGVLDSQGYPPAHYEQAPPVTPATGPMNAQPVLPMAPPGAQPASYPPPPFLVPPPQFIPPQTAPPSLINYVPAPNGPSFQNYQGYQGYNPAVQVHEQVDYVQQGPPPPPQELFQPQGCTYYSPAQQQQQQAPPQQSAPVRRPKAIPILPPPENQQSPQPGKGRGRPTASQQNSNQRPGLAQTEQSQTQYSVEAQSETLYQSEAQFQAEPQFQSENQLQTEIQFQQEIQTQPEPTSESPVKLQSEPPPESYPQTEIESKIEPKSEFEPKSENEASLNESPVEPIKESVPIISEPEVASIKNTVVSEVTTSLPTENVTNAEIEPVKQVVADVAEAVSETEKLSLPLINESTMIKNEAEGASVAHESPVVEEAAA